MKYINAFDFIEELYSDAITDEQREFAKRVEYAIEKTAGIDISDEEIIKYKKYANSNNRR